jgi:hypothetical protein
MDKTGARSMFKQNIFLIVVVQLNEFFIGS